MSYGMLPSVMFHVKHISRAVQRVSHETMLFTKSK